jgi:hypothetical protein
VKAAVYLAPHKYLPGGTEENNGTPQSGQPVRRPRLQLRTFRIWKSNVNHSTITPTQLMEKWVARRNRKRRQRNNSFRQLGAWLAEVTDNQNYFRDDSVNAICDIPLQHDYLKPSCLTRSECVYGPQEKLTFGLDSLPRVNFLTLYGKGWRIYWYDCQQDRKQTCYVL